MSFFESLLALLTVAVLLLQVSRRLAIPYPTMLAGAGVLLALVPGAPRIGLDPRTALPLFVAPALVDAALAAARTQLAAAAIAALQFDTGPPADHWRYAFETARSAVAPAGDSASLEEWRRLGLAATRSQRAALDSLRDAQRVDSDTYLTLQAELDFSEVALIHEDQRRIEES